MMTLFPEVQKKAQEELDRVIGPDRLPEFKDRDQLPYINALVSETSRWQPIGKLSVPHQVIKDDVHEGYFIPKGSIILPNVWSFTHDPGLYRDPDVYNPSRFLSTDGNEPETNPMELIFGFGRRSCPGMHLADSSLWMASAMILATFNISKVVEDGVTIEPSVKYTSGTVSHPKPFKCSIKPRFAQSENLIRAVDERIQ